MKSEKQLYQWDVNQYLIELQPTAQFVDYPMGNEVIRIETEGKRCRIPDEFLQTAGFKTCYERYSDGTYKAYNFNVQSSPKPPDYVYTTEERTTFDALVAKADAAIAEIKRRADSGEFTPVKGVDYFTDAEKLELMESVSSGAVGEFRKVVDTATTEYNDNHNLKLAKYNANASEKLTTYDVNAEQRTTDYNRNAEQKMESYNQNATTKTAEFDANAAALQTEVDRLRGECDNLAEENRKQENRISALLKLNKGQTYDILPEEGESASRTAPSGAKYVSVDKVGGKSVVWNQLWNYGKTEKEDGVTFTYENHFYDVVKNTTANNGLLVYYNVKENNKYYLSFEASSSDNIMLTLSLGRALIAKLTEKNERYSTIITTDAIIPVPRAVIYLYSQSGVNCSYRVGNIKVIDLSAMFGVGNEPTAEEFEQMFPEDSYPYNPGEIISSRTETITAGAESITTGFPELRSARTAHDYIDMDDGEARRNVGVVDLGTLDWTYSEKYGWLETVSLVGKIVAPPGSSIAANVLCDKFETIVQNDNATKTGVSVWTNGKVSIKGENLTTGTDLSGAVLYYELATPTTESITIPEALTEWLPVEAGGTVTFQNADESKQLAVPNVVSWVRKLNEVE